MGPFRRTATAFALTLLTACGSPGAEGDGAGGGVETWTVGTEPLVSIGGADDRADYLVYRVIGATRLSDGRIVVASQGYSDLRFYTPTGEHERTVGGPGGGPGEYEAIFELAGLPDDELLVVSRSPGLTWLSSDGEYLRSLRAQVWGRERHPCRILGASDWSALPDGRLVAQFNDNLGQPGCDPMVADLHRTSALIELQDFEGQLFDTIAIMPGTERNNAVFRVYGRDLVLTTASGRIYAADTGSDTILALGLEGDTVAVLPVPYEPVAIPAAAKATASRPPLERPPPDVPFDLNPPYDYPEHYPRIGRLLADRLDQLWVMAYPRVELPTSSWPYFTTSQFVVEAGGARWRVLDPEGRLIAEVRTPPSVYPLEIGEDYILGVVKDEYEVEAVVMYSLER